MSTLRSLQRVRVRHLTAALAVVFAALLLRPVAGLADVPPDEPEMLNRAAEQKRGVVYAGLAATGGTLVLGVAAVVVRRRRRLARKP